MPLTESMMPSQNLPYFPNVTKHHIHFYGTVSINVIDYLPKIINSSQLIKVKLENLYLDDDQNLLCDLFLLLPQSLKLSSLIIDYCSSQYIYHPVFDTILPFLSSQINCLRILIENFEQLEIIFHRCHHLAVLQIDNEIFEYSTDLESWFEENRRNSIFQSHSKFDTIWIGGKKEEEIFNRKRIKLIDEEI